MTAVVDTSVLFAQRSAHDEYHEQAREIIAGVDHGQLPEFHITDHVLAETLNLIQNKADHQKATQTMALLIEGSHFHLRHTPKADFNSTQALFRRHSHLSFVDASIVAFMQREGIEYLYSFDDGFDTIEGITRLNTAVDPR
ncbi:type II toxin-antitoxin system VapC family toxin [Natrinema salsiterrestre]|uniref:Ribonuclease VapC n=1 Tax=Natrinema salsiterrestre TaxID=2950540 RepID=A0A9Q4L2Q9_9EURY|nr:PIN domain-containing protein [Natrinema salsiterrestre]MDF9745407.1 PIN domain-containing protein [Natrinema salsiterrestre]